MARKRVTPSAVSATYAELKRKYDFPISLKRISGHYYLYKQVIKWQREKKKYVCMEMQYLGSISEEGTFRPRKMVEGDVESAKAVIMAHGGKVIMDKEPVQSKAPVAPLNLTDLDRTILTELTMDGRLQVSELAKSLNVPERKLGYRIRALEQKLDINYKPKVRLEGLGYMYFIVFAKFTGQRPDSAVLQAELDKLPSVQFAAMSTNSKYDLTLIIATLNDYNADQSSASGESLPVILKRIRMIPALKDVMAEWYVSYFDIAKGFMPIRQPLMEERIVGSVWTKRKERQQNSISKNEYATLAAINANGAESFRAIEQRSGMPDGSAKYSYDSLVSRNILSGVTICMNGLPVLYNVLLIMEIVDEGAYAESRHEVFRIETTERKDHIANRISLAANMGAPYGGIFFLPIMRDGELEELQQELYSKVKGIKLSAMIMTKVLCGAVPYNRFDNKKTVQHQQLMEIDKKLNRS